jgi:transposase
LYNDGRQYGNRVTQAIARRYAYPARLKLHLILDNYGTHNHPNVNAWLAAHPRFVLHFTPTGSSWLNLVERWFRELTDKTDSTRSFRQRRWTHPRLRQFIDAYNSDPGRSLGSRPRSPSSTRSAV